MSNKVCAGACSRLNLPDDLPIEDLPKSLRDIAEVIGLPAAMQLIHHWAGVRLWVPELERLRSDHPLVCHLGWDAAEKLCYYYGLCEIWVPKAGRAVRSLRNAEIRARYQAGEPAHLLAPVYGLTDRMIWRIVSTKDADKQIQTK